MAELFKDGFESLPAGTPAAVGVAALVGVGLGYLTVDAMNDDYMRIMIGVISLLFGLHK